MSGFSSDPGFAERRARARIELDAIDPAKGAAPDAADPLRRGWFEAVYALAENDAARVPWANLSPHPLTRSFVDLQMRGLEGLCVLDVGCGLGDNAECFSAAGADVTAFDLVEEAVQWAKRRFPDSKVAYSAEDLFKVPPEWREKFDLVHECYTLQALAPELLPKALAALASLLAPDGKLLVIARARDEDAPASGPPWPLPPSIFAQAERHGLRRVVIEDIAATAEVPIRHWRALLRRSDAA
ncbi:class I SAM-dependent methyltransferase [Methylocella tundrae]|uniref:SAM-dependent methyltransferase n=1 Tax=Methylocella tundrae TaxID=227605 RepID=A0A4U8Z5D8_METTU|nr:methyltransferase domain-containing protein [Methylocella tundrae]WPP04386.1 methyltransferase domain-containing protein [Methylocella tundrae]VFU10738.1 SAM-dependent methyltransferase [Methylocella tundrae]